jgi:glycerol-3-phosphate dehydrogenase subunit B
MPSADVAVIGAGLAGLATAIRLAERGARVVVLAQGNGAIQWAGGPIDIAVTPGAVTAADALQRLAADPGHPYAALGADVAPALDWFSGLTADGGLPHTGSLDAPFGALPTGIGGTRPVTIVPESQAAALRPWDAGERLLVVGPAGYKDFWPRAVAASLSRPSVWGGLSRPDRVDGIAVELPGLGARRNLNALRIGEQFDDPAWRRAALDAIGRAVEGAGTGPLRIGLPAVLGCRVHPAVLREALERLGHPILELPLVPPGIPGIRLYGLLRAVLLARGGRLLLGEPVARVETDGRRVVSVATAAATRELVTRVGALVLATGGLGGGGLVGDPDGRIVESVLGLPVEGPPIDRWMTGDALDPGGMPIATAGIRTDPALRPVDPAHPADGPLFDNVHVVGALLAGQRYLNERCGDGIALASAWRAAASLATEPPAAIGAAATATGTAAIGGGVR